MDYLFPLQPGPLPPATGVLNGWQITSYFGGRIDPLTGRAGNHGGMDLAYYGCSGQPMIAVADGTVAQGWDNSGGGNWSGLTTTTGDYFGYGHAQRVELGPGVRMDSVAVATVRSPERYAETRGGFARKVMLSTQSVLICVAPMTSFVATVVGGV